MSMSPIEYLTNDVRTFLFPLVAADPVVAPTLETTTVLLSGTSRLSTAEIEAQYPGQSVSSRYGLTRTDEERQARMDREIRARHTQPQFYRPQKDGI